MPAAPPRATALRRGAGMNDEERGFSPGWANQVAEGGPLDWTRGRERRARFFSTGFGTGRAGGAGRAFACFWTGGAAFRPFAASRAAGFGGFAGAFLAGAAAFFATFRTAVLGRAARATTFLLRRLRAPPEVFFPCALAIFKKEWRSIAINRFPVEGFRADSPQSA